MSPLKNVLSGAMKASNLRSCPRGWCRFRTCRPTFIVALKAGAAMEGMSMSDYILREVGKALDRPTRLEVLKRLRSRPTRR
jgi:hypothetical protein